MRLVKLARSPLVLRSHVVRAEFELGGLTCDSRLANAETGFFALRGFKEDGHDYLAAAVAAGAPVLFVSHPAEFERLAAGPPAGTAGIFLVAPGRGALAELAALIHGDPSHGLILFGVTGTNGKTTTSHLVGQIYRALGERCGVIGSLGAFLDGEALPGERTTPEAPEVQAFLRRCLEGGAGHAVMEATSIGIALERTRGLRFRAAAFTNLTQDHLDFHGSLAEYAEAKYRLFLDHETGAAVVNRDDPVGRELVKRLEAGRPEMPVLTFGLEPGASLRAEKVSLTAEGSKGELIWQGGRYPYRTSLIGRFNLLNMLTAAGLLLAAGEPMEGVVENLSACRGVPGRFERVPAGRDFTVVVDYAHTPDALENALAAARPLTAGRLVVVFGCGGDRDTAKRPMMGAIAERLADAVVLTSDNPRGEDPESIIAEIAKGLGHKPAARNADREAAIRETLGQAGPGDLVLIAGKGHEQYQEIRGEKRPFDDREVVLAWARQKAKAGKTAKA